jgi:hypothetical protein
MAELGRRRRGESFAFTSLLLLLLVTVAVGTLLTPATAHARKQVDHRYRYEQVWSASVRLVRVDLRYQVDDQSPEAGFVLFQYRDGDRSYPGSIELVRTEIDGQPHVRVIVQIASMPAYVEQLLVDRLARKLREEYGEPPAARGRRPAREPAADDEGDGEGNEREREREGDRRRDRDRPNGEREPNGRTPRR